MRQKVCVIGLGYVGFPTVCVVAHAGYSVIGVDIDSKIISNIHEGHHMSWDNQLQDLFKAGMHSHTIKITHQIETADIYIIAVQTPVDTNHKPDITYVQAAIDAIKVHIREGNLILIESTCPIGTTQIMAQKLRTICANIHVAYCPERIFPHKLIDELTNNNRVVGGIDQASGIRAANFYRSFVRGQIEITDTNTAEAVKLAENTYRDINIAYANELSMIANHVNINVHELIRLANQHPRVNILQPGPGVGGHCIAVDPYFLAHAAPKFAALTIKAREVNNKKTNWVIEKIHTQAKKNKVNSIVCLGLTYKANVPDQRQSPAITITEALKQDFNIIAIDPYVTDIVSMEQSFMKVEMIVVLVAHREFFALPNHWLQEKIILDFTEMCINENNIDHCRNTT